MLNILIKLGLTALALFLILIIITLILILYVFIRTIFEGGKKMTNEEKEAIDWLKDELDGEKKSHKNCNYSYKGVTGLYGNNEVEIALKLIEKQQKEIEYLKRQIPQDKIFYYSEKDYISKDKIKAKIQEFEYEGTREYWAEQIIQMLKALIGESKNE